MIDDVKESVSSVLKERLVSPVFGSFLVSWVLWNLPLLYYIFTVDSKIKVQERWAYIQTNYGSTWNLLWLPLISSVVAMLLFPVLSGVVTLFRIKIDSIVKELSFGIQKKTPITQDDALALYERIDKGEERMSRLLKDKDATIISLNTHIEENKKAYEQSFSEQKDEFEETKRNIDEIQGEITSKMKSLEEQNSELSKQNIYLRQHVDAVIRDKESLQKSAENLYERIFPKGLSFYQSQFKEMKRSKLHLDAFKLLDSVMGPSPEYYPRKFENVPDSLKTTEYLNIIKRFSNQGFITLKVPSGSDVNTTDLSFAFNKVGEELRTYMSLFPEINESPTYAAPPPYGIAPAKGA